MTDPLGATPGTIAVIRSGLDERPAVVANHGSKRVGEENEKTAKREWGNRVVSEKRRSER